MEVFVAIGNRHRSYGNFCGRVCLRRSVPGDLSLVIDRLQVNDNTVFAESVVLCPLQV